MRGSPNQPMIPNQEIMIPERIYLSFDYELMYLRELTVYPTPAISDYQFSQVFRTLIVALEREGDIEFQTAAWGYDTINQYFGHFIGDDVKIQYIQERLDKTSSLVNLKLKQLGMYIGGIFPYKMESISGMNDVTFVKSYRGRLFNLPQEFSVKPYVFKI